MTANYYIVVLVIYRQIQIQNLFSTCVLKITYDVHICTYLSASDYNLILIISLQILIFNILDNIFLLIN